MNPLPSQLILATISTVVAYNVIPLTKQVAREQISLQEKASKIAYRSLAIVVTGVGAYYAIRPFCPFFSLPRAIALTGSGAVFTLAAGALLSFVKPPTKDHIKWPLRVAALSLVLSGTVLTIVSLFKNHLFRRG